MQAQVAEPPPPRLEDASAVDSARKRLTKRAYLTLDLPRIPSLRAWWVGRRRSRALTEQHIRPDDATLAEIDLNDSFDDLNIRQDIYKWAVVYENQRGITIFSTPYYSRLGLLPHDPPPFTIPEADGRKDKQPQVTLHDYPLPDGDWRWVSRTWMVDMRSEGQVHYDGFEYNWLFRRHKWRPEPGAFSAGGWVRRRRWVRLMIRPARPIEQSDDGGSQNLAFSPPPTRSPIVPDDTLELEAAKAAAWSDEPNNWERIHYIMVRSNRDGTRLELWREWLGVPPQTRQRNVWSEDEYSLPSEEKQNRHATKARPLAGAQRENLAAVVRDHTEDLIQLFVYPESRAEFLGILDAAGITIRRDVLSPFNDPGVEFWSYTRGPA
ncbi:hypothetical protein EDB87DRAFT_1592987 [Lactarius vividus]|nr:hypothetical protein EDB87DRAFT_1592987 [Lactarius vividus]